MIHLYVILCPASPGALAAQQRLERPALRRSRTILRAFNMEFVFLSPRGRRLPQVQFSRNKLKVGV